MKAPTATAQTWLVDIAPERCAELLEHATLGRLAVIIDGKPEIFPINHVYDRLSNAVCFPTRPGTKMSAILSWPSIAFEVDGIDPAGGGGWSVAVVGAPAEIFDSAEIARFTAQRDLPWALDPTVRWIRIVSSKVTGRRISAVAAAPPPTNEGHRSASGWDLGPYPARYAGRSMTATNKETH